MGLKNTSGKCQYRDESCQKKVKVEYEETTHPEFREDQGNKKNKLITE